MIRNFAPALLGLLVFVAACSEENPAPDDTGSGGTSGGSSGAGGSGGTSGQATGGSSTGGSGGSAVGGTGGSGTGGSAGTTGGTASGGVSGSGGSGTSGSANAGGSAGANVGGSAGAGGAAGSAGSSSGGTAGGGAGTAGTGGTAGTAGSGGTGPGNAAVADDFEGAMLDATKWEQMLTGQNGTIALSTEQHRSGTQSVKVVGMSGITMFVNKSLFPLPNGVLHLRAWMYFTAGNWDNHIAFIAATPGEQSQEVRFGGQMNAYHANLAGDGDGLSPDPWEQPSCSLCLTPVPNAWVCLRGMFDFTNSDATLYVDETLAVDARDADDWHSGTGTFPQNPTQIGFGWSVYGGGPNTLYFDDIALGYEPIACE